ncbi:polysaccharide deacetylase family protein [Balneolaceae bacterium YR4-1]|uniref:Polysaccharide deacetylase family protein n=1 Tax=Halalkalibaculum roseum TaxID=2709311 RepID=A0A6M1SZP7_9BACT|nr:polysaccharide deacetylase family protein [Halalkalibaculum roseum]NGP77366.1 polysaccharide deacetylase family protein [Halalkalibaculum roseum]
MKKISVVFIFLFASLWGLWHMSKSRNFQISGQLISHVENADSLIALTFDDGPTPQYTDAVLAILEKYDVPATFFVTGKETENNIQEAQKIVRAGHQLGNHSYSHQQMVLKSYHFHENEIERTDQSIRNAGYQGEIYFRPPYCKKLFLLPWILSQKNKVSVTWNIEPESFADVRDNAQKIATHVEQKVKPGSIILLHVMYESREESRKSLPIIIENLKQKGYKFVTINELIRDGSDGSV